MMQDHAEGPIRPTRSVIDKYVKALGWQQYQGWPPFRKNTDLLGRGNKPDGIPDGQDDPQPLYATVTMPNGENADVAWLSERKTSLNKRDPTANRTTLEDFLCPRVHLEKCQGERGVPFTFEDYFRGNSVINPDKVNAWLGEIIGVVPNAAIKRNMVPFCKNGLVLADDEHHPQDLSRLLFGALVYAEKTESDVLDNAWGANASMTHPHFQPVGIKLRAFNTSEKFSREHPEMDHHIQSLEQCNGVRTAHISKGMNGTPIVIKGDLFGVFAAGLAAKELLRDPNDPERELDSKVNIAIRWSDAAKEYTLILSPRSFECPENFIDGVGYVYPVEDRSGKIEEIAVACNPAGAEMMAYWPTPEIDSYN